jgi:hypothetical protein
MRIAFAVFAALLIQPASAAAAAANGEFISRAAVTEWFDNYRKRPEPSRLPAAVQALSKSGALRDPENSGFHVGFVAAVLGANPKKAPALIMKMLPLPEADQWALVRAIAYSGLPEWKRLLRDAAPRLAARQAMIDQYLAGSLPTLDAIELDKSPTFLEKLHMHLGGKPIGPDISFGRNPELLDTLWGQYFATGEYQPVYRILSMLPWSKDRDSIERLTVGSMAKVTLANNATMYPDLLVTLKAMAKYQAEDVAGPLTEVIKAAETSTAPNLKKQAMANIDELKRKGPGYKRDMTVWGHVGQGAIAIGCIAAAVASLTTLGLPCVIGGAVASAALNYYTAQ